MGALKNVLSSKSAKLSLKSITKMGGGEEGGICGDGDVYSYTNCWKCQSVQMFDPYLTPTLP